jgi:superoxide dismutase
MHLRKKMILVNSTRHESQWWWYAKRRTDCSHRHKPLLCATVWEHAHYIDYRNVRPKFIDTFPNHPANNYYSRHEYLIILSIILTN